MIERIRGPYSPGISKSSAYRDLLWIVATATDEDLDLAGQTAQALELIENSLAELGSDKTRIVSAQVFLANMDEKPIMHELWRAWIGGNPAHWPQRACLGVELEGKCLVEITVTAVRQTG